MFLEIDLPKQLTKIWEVNVQKFTFSCAETWKPATSLQTDIS